MPRKAKREPPPVKPKRTSRAPLWALLTGVIPALLAFAHTPYINGPYYWKWNYLGVNPAPFLAMAAIAWAVLYWADSQAAEGARLGSSLCALVGLAWVLTFSFTALTRNGLGTVEDRVKNPDSTSYYTEALKIESVGEWLDEFDQRLPRMALHAATHPPLPTLWYWAWNRLLGPDKGAFYGGSALGVISGLVVFPLFSLALRVTDSRTAALATAAVWAVLPASTIMLGCFDTAYVALSTTLLVLWIRAAWDGRMAAAAAFGVVLFVSLMFSHSFLMLGAAFALLGIAPAAFGADPREQVRRFAQVSVVALTVVAGLLAASWAAFGYDHYAALRQSMRNQEGFAAILQRPWEYTVVWDVYDFFLASGWVSFGVLVAFGLRWRSQGAPLPRPWMPAFAASAIATLVIVDLSGLLRAETARVWLFLQPLTLPLIGYELSKWSSGWRLAGFGVLVFSLAAIRSRMAFI